MYSLAIATVLFPFGRLSLFSMSLHLENVVSSFHNYHLAIVIDDDYFFLQCVLMRFALKTDSSKK
jgi:hypothetical protein